MNRQIREENDGLSNAPRQMKTNELGVNKYQLDTIGGDFTDCHELNPDEDLFKRDKKS